MYFNPLEITVEHEIAAERYRILQADRSCQACSSPPGSAHETKRSWLDWLRPFRSPSSECLFF